MNSVHNAQTTLTATIVNNLAAAFIVAGFIAPAANGQLTFGAIAWIGVGIGLHLLARSILGGLKQ